MSDFSRPMAALSSSMSPTACMTSEDFLTLEPYSLPVVPLSPDFVAIFIRIGIPTQS